MEIKFLLISILALLAVSNIVLAEYIEPTIWPQPKLFQYEEKNTVTKVSKFEFNTKNYDISTLNDAYKRYDKLIFIHPTDEYISKDSKEGVINQVEVKVENDSEDYPQLDTDESYTLTVPTSSSSSSESKDADEEKIVITAKTVYGVLRGLESLSQLVIYDFDNDCYYISSTPIYIEDSPRYPHRGMLLDTARHFQSIPFLQSTIDSLSYAKYNVLHWHVVDTQSFPFESKTYPNLWKGAYTASERYSHEDIIDLVEYGRARGVKIMIEFDVPGHAASWCAGYPEICPNPVSCKQPLDPSSNLTFPLITSLLSECTGTTGVIQTSNNDVTTTSQKQHTSNSNALFPYTLLHLGGDEVSYTCWEANLRIRKWEKEQGLDGSEATYEYFVDKVATIARNQKRTPVQWVEVFEHFGSALDMNTVVHVWKEKTTLDGVLSAGYNALLSNQDFWYLDHLQTTWDKMYGNEPTAGLSSTSNPALILGGESCMWGETVDSSDLHNTVWPRAAAVSEVLWSPVEYIYPNGNVSDTSNINWEVTEDRLETFRCLLNQRGISAAPVTNRQARYQPKEPGSCYVQRRRI